MDYNKFEIEMTKDFLDFLVSMKAEGIENSLEVIGVLQDMLCKPYVKPPLSDQLRAYLIVLSDLIETGLTDIGDIITTISNVYFEQTLENSTNG